MTLTNLGFTHSPALQTVPIKPSIPSCPAVLPLVTCDDDVLDHCHNSDLLIHATGSDARAPSSAGIQVADCTDGLGPVEVDLEDMETWEDELEERERGGVEVRSWEEL